MKKVLVTGGAGYLGKHLAKTLYNAGHEVYCIDRIRANCKYYQEEVEADFRKYPDSLYRVLIKNIDTVFHLAGRIEVGLSWDEPISFWQDNMMSTMFLIDMMKKHGVSNLVYSSSAGVYKPKDGLISESDPLGYNNPYANSKIAAENAIRDSGINHVVFRFFNLAGADPDGEMGEDHHTRNSYDTITFSKQR